MFDQKLIIWFCWKELLEILYRLTAVYHLQPKIRTMTDIKLWTVLSTIKVAGGMAVVTVPIWTACTFTDNTLHMQTVSTGLRGKDTSTRQKEQKWRSSHKRFKPDKYHGSPLSHSTHWCSCHEKATLTLIGGLSIIISMVLIGWNSLLASSSYLIG